MRKNHHPLPHPDRWLISPSLTLLLLTASMMSVCRAEYSVPADAIRIGADELAADQLTDHLLQLMGDNNDDNSTSGNYNSISSQENDDDDDDNDDHLPKALLRLDALLRSAEERKQKLESSARILSINRGGFFRGLLIVWVPVSFLLPTLARHPTYYRRGRATNRFKSVGWTKTAPDTNELNYDPTSPDYLFDPTYGPLLSRMEGYFGLLRVEDLNCRWKLLCHAARETDEFQPLSNLFRRLFERSQSFPRPGTYHPALKKFFTYVWADKKGRRFSSAEQCDQEYSSCKVPVQQLIRVDMLLFWQKLSKRFAIQIQDE